MACDDDEDNGDGEDTPAAEETDSGEGDATEPASETEPAGSETPGASNGDPGAFTTVVATENPELGTILTTFDGFTVYTFDNDSGGTSSCTGDCASTWPPLPASGEPTAGEGVSGAMGTIQRDDGSMQVTYDGQPLYMYASDAAPGDTNGDGVGGIWHVVTLE
jgi:predicted lipoprotein with Yx(FWY)xxD motif